MTRGRRSWPPPTRPPCLSRPPGTWLPRRTARSRKPVPCRRLGLDHADLQHPQLDRAELQAGQRRAGWAEFQVAPMSRSAAIRLWSAASPPSAALPGCRHPTAAQPSVAAARTWQRKGGLHTALPRRRPGPGRCARYAPGSPLDHAAALVATMVQSAPPPQLHGNQKCRKPCSCRDTQTSWHSLSLCAARCSRWSLKTQRVTIDRLRNLCPSASGVGVQNERTAPFHDRCK